MQPTYLPWAGYFNLVANVDVFVFLDDVQFEHQSWQTRNRILLQGQPHLLVVPVSRVPLDTRIVDIRIANDGSWRRKHLRSLESAYARHPFAGELFELLAPVLADESCTGLAALNQGIVQAFCRGMGIGTEFQTASSLQCGGTRSAHLLELCTKLGCADYLSPVGSRGYLEEDRFEENPSVRLSFQDFRPATYPQPGVAEFVSHLSIVDVVANLGLRAAADYVRG